MHAQRMHPVFHPAARHSCCCRMGDVQDADVKTGYAPDSVPPSIDEFAPKQPVQLFDAIHFPKHNKLIAALHHS